MSRVSERDLTPRNGHTLMAGLLARISGCVNQKEQSLEDQTDHNKEIIEEMFDGPIEYLIIATKGKGELLKRPELAQIEAEFREGCLDVFVIEDLGRLVRGTEAVRLLGVAVDHGIRVIVPNDNIDTVRDTWEADAIKACADHVAHNAHTSRRIKHKLRNRFVKLGGPMALPIAGYIVPAGVKTYDGWQKDPAADSWVQDGARMLLETLNYSAVADMLNARGVPTGKYCRNKVWDRNLVKRFYATPTLKGSPSRGAKHSIKIYETGQRKSVKNPGGPVFYNCPHLAYLDPTDFDELQSKLKERHARSRRIPVGGKDPLFQVPRKRTTFPGQHGRCWYCGCHHVWGGNGITENLMCGNAKEWHCWSSVSYNGQTAVKRVMEAITRELYQLESFDDQYRELVAQAGGTNQSDLSLRWERLKSNEIDLEKLKERFVEAIAKYGEQPMFQVKMEEIHAEELRLRVERRALDRFGKERFDVPESLSILREMLEQEFVGAAQESPEFGDLLRKLCPDFFVYLVRHCDGGRLYPRARVRLALDGILQDHAVVPGLGNLLSREVTIDLFEPPQRERIRTAAAEWAARGLGPKAIAAEIAASSAERPSVITVRNALSLDARMRDLGLALPYVMVDSPPDDYPKLRRHKNGRYQFVPLDGYTAPPLV